VPTVETTRSVCRCGIARCDITPPVGIYHRMWGAASHDRSTGVHRPLTATALVFAPATGAGEQVVVVVDHCLLWAPEHGALEAALCAGAGVAPEDLIVTYSHTHAAGLMGLERSRLPGGELIAPYLDELGRRLVRIVAAARDSAAPASIAYTTGRCTLAAHRDSWDADAGEWVCGFNPAGPADDTVLVARVADVAGRTRATVVNYACHPTTLAWQNTLISPDFPGAMREVVEQGTGAPCVFLQGTSGDLGPVEGFVGDVAIADRNGRQLGYAALSALESLPPPFTRFQYAGSVMSGTKIGCWEHIPLTPLELAQKGRWSQRRLTVDLDYRAEIISTAKARGEQARWQAEEERARKGGDSERAQTCRALAEQMGRWIVRTESLPPGDTYPFAVTLLRLGDALWVAVEAEPYCALQRDLRAAFPQRPLMVISLAGGGRPTYLPTREAYGTRVYQDTIAVLEAGSLERLTAVLREELARLTEDA
jgi:hypothetical protein